MFIQNNTIVSIKMSVNAKSCVIILLCQHDSIVIRLLFYSYTVYNTQQQYVPRNNSMHHENNNSMHHEKNNSMHHENNNSMHHENNNSMHHDNNNSMYSSTSRIAKEFQSIKGFVNNDTPIIHPIPPYIINS